MVLRGFKTTLIKMNMFKLIPGPFGSERTSLTDVSCRPFKDKENGVHVTEQTPKKVHLMNRASFALDSSNIAPKQRKAGNRPHSVDAMKNVSLINGFHESNFALTFTVLLTLPNLNAFGIV